MGLASHIYAAVAGFRRRRILERPDRRRRLGRPVISVGNLAVGGSGKTPLAAWLARLLADAGERPAILSRGYGRTDPVPGVTIVSDGVRLRADLPRAGDEPLMLARALPGVSVLVCPDRFLAGRLAERHLGATVHLLDDGFQHVQLERDVNLLILDRADLASGETLPTGRLREPLEAARDADALLLAGMEEGTGDGVGGAAHLGVGATFTLTRQFEPAVEEAAGGPRPVAPATRVVAVCGIARPDRFFAGLDGTGLVVADHVSFRDHHGYAAADIARLAATLRAAGADTILTTEKDLVRLLPLRPWPFRVAVRPMSVRVEPAGAFSAWLLDRLGACRARRREAA